MTVDTAAAAERYLEFWNADSPEAQRELAPTVFTEDVDYHAPVGVLSGVEALIDFRTSFTGHMGAVSFVARSAPEGHNDRVRLRWEIQLAGGDSFATGTDVLSLTPGGRINSITAFLDRAPEGFDQHAHA